jgi:chemotaxis signal transduction protein
MAVIRGAKLPVMDLAALLGRNTSPATRFVTIRTRTRVIALAVSWIAGLKQFNSHELEDLPPVPHAPAVPIEDDLREVFEGCRVLPGGGS